MASSPIGRNVLDMHFPQARMLGYLSFFTIALLIVRKLYIRYSEKRYCAYGDLKVAGDAIPQDKKKKCAVIIGASISGILSARICADHFEKVILIDAEDCTTDPTVKRKRVKQHEQLHLFLGLMYPALMKLFPDFLEEVKKAGGSIAPPQPVVYRGGGFVKVPLTANEWDTRQLYISREVLEALLRRLVLERFPHVTAIHGNVSDLVAEGDTVKAVALRRPDGSTENIAGDFFLDCSGTANGSIGWLRKLGYNKPEKMTYDPAIVYTCFTFQMTPEMIQKFNKLGGPYKWEETGHLGACFSSTHHSVFMKIDHDRVRTMYQTYVGRGGEPETPEDLLDAVRRAPYLKWQKEAVAMLCGEGMENQPEYVMSRVTIGQCYRVTYRSQDMPRNMLPLGDTILRVNPIFGQGCTKSVIEVLTLDNTLRKFSGKATSRKMVEHFLDLRYARTDAFWEDTRLLDYACEDTKPLAGETADTGASYRRFKSWVVNAAQKDQNIGKTLTETMSALRPATALYDPGFLLRVWLANTLG